MSQALPELPTVPESIIFSEPFLAPPGVWSSISNGVVVLSILIAIILVWYIAITKTKLGAELGANYIKNHLVIHFRSACLALLATGLIYTAFIVNKTQLVGDLKINAATLEGDIKYANTILTKIKLEQEFFIIEMADISVINSPTSSKRNLNKEVTIIDRRLRVALNTLSIALNRVLDIGSWSNVGMENALLDYNNENSEATTDRELFFNKVKLLNSYVDILKVRLNTLESWLSAYTKIFNTMSDKLTVLESSKYTENIYLAMRALSLGALGALITLLVAHILVPQRKNQASNFIKSPHFWPYLLGHILMGSIVAVVVFGLFYTKQLTIFKADTTSKEVLEPEFWRVTMLCIIAGAFSEKLYGAASNRLDKYTEEDENKQPVADKQLVPIPVSVETNDKDVK